MNLWSVTANWCQHKDKQIKETAFTALTRVFLHSSPICSFIRKMSLLFTVVSGDPETTTDANTCRKINWFIQDRFGGLTWFKNILEFLNKFSFFQIRYSSFKLINWFQPLAKHNSQWSRFQGLIKHPKNKTPLWKLVMSSFCSFAGSLLTKCSS